MRGTGTIREQLLDVVQEAGTDPLRALAAIKKIQALAGTMSDAPYTLSRLYCPGLYMPCDSVINVPGIEVLPAGDSTSNAIPIVLKTPGVIVGIHAAFFAVPQEGQSLPAGNPAAGLAFQLSLESTKSFASDGDNTQGVFAALSMFSEWNVWTPTMLPVRGAGSWSLYLQNNLPCDVQIIFMLAQIMGKDLYRACARGDDD
jgi:hypothetical protein